MTYTPVFKVKFRFWRRMHVEYLKVVMTDVTLH
jgi:hypothetical protein